MCIGTYLLLNPFPPSCPNWDRLAKKIDLRKIIENISYERRNYESVDEKSLPYIGYVPKNKENKNSGSILKPLT